MTYNQFLKDSLTSIILHCSLHLGLTGFSILTLLKKGAWATRELLDGPLCFWDSFKMNAFQQNDRFKLVNPTINHFYNKLVVQKHPKTPDNVSSTFLSDFFFEIPGSRCHHKLVLG